MVGAIPHEIMCCYILYTKGKDDMYAPAALQKLYRLYGFWNIKSKI